MAINQGDIYWINFGESNGSGAGYRHPHVVIQNNIFNKSRINTVVVCALTSNIKRAYAPGNVLLRKGEGNLTKKSVINISQIFSIDKKFLDEKIGSLTKKRSNEIIQGLKLLLEPREL